MRPATRDGFGVALGGGTARAVAHVGALSVLADRGFTPQAIAGTSSGAIIGAMLALGASAREVEAVILAIEVGALWRQALDPGLAEASLIRGRRLEAWLDREVFHGATFDDVRTPFVVACTDLATGELVVVRRGSIAHAVVAASALPGYFAPVVEDGVVRVDGGLVEAVPYRALAHLAPARALGLHAGIDAGRSRLILLVRRLQATAWGARGREWLLARGAAGPLRRLARGTALAAQSYDRGIVVPPGARLVSMLPPVAWWDFHRSAEAIAFGARAMERAFAHEDLERWLRGTPTRSGPDAAAADDSAGADEAGGRAPRRDAGG